MPQLPRSSFRDSGRRRSLFDSDAIVWVQPCAEPTAGRANAARVIGAATSVTCESLPPLNKHNKSGKSREMRVFVDIPCDT
jgi:hypothetical protein